MTGQVPEPGPGPLVMLGQVGVLLILASGALVLVGAAGASVLVGMFGVGLVVVTLAVPVVAAVLFVLLLVGGSGDPQGEPELERPGPGVEVRWQEEIGHDRYGMDPSDVGVDGFDDEWGRW